MTPSMTSHARLLAAFRREPVDRVPMRIWGFDHRQEQLEPSYQQLAALAHTHELDLLNVWGPRTETTATITSEHETRSTRHEGFVEDVTTLHTPAGPLTTAYLRSLEGKPGYQSKHLLETPEDAERWLSIPWSPPVVDCSGWPHAVTELGEEGLLMANINEPMYSIQDLTGPETWAFWLIEERELLHRLVSEVSRRELHTLKEMLAQGVRGVYCYVGPEVCIPPLASLTDFDDFVVRYDEPFHDLIHDAGGMVWVHCHGSS
jgi:hypothetical protein